MFNKIKEVFTKEYRDETKYRELLKQNINCFKFVSPLKEESVDKKVKRLREKNFISKFSIKI